MRQSVPQNGRVHLHTIEEAIVLREAERVRGVVSKSGGTAQISCKGMTVSFIFRTLLLKLAGPQLQLNLYKMLPYVMV